MCHFMCHFTNFSLAFWVTSNLVCTELGVLSNHCRRSKWQSGLSKRQFCHNEQIGQLYHWICFIVYTRYTLSTLSIMDKQNLCKEIIITWTQTTKDCKIKQYSQEIKNVYRSTPVTNQNYCITSPNARTVCWNATMTKKNSYYIIERTTMKSYKTIISNKNNQTIATCGTKSDQDT